MTRKEELLEVSCKDYYMYGTLIKSLLKKDVLDDYIKDISDDEFEVKGSCIFKTDYITHNELFIYNLDRFIYFFKHKLLIEEGESRYILEVILKSKYAKLLLEKTFCFDMDYIKHYDTEYKKIICDSFYENIKFLKLTFSNFFNEEKINEEKETLIGKNLENIFTLLRGMVNCKRSNIYYLFIDVDDLGTQNRVLDYYVDMWEGIIQTYQKKKKHLLLLES